MILFYGPGLTCLGERIESRESEKSEMRPCCILNKNNLFKLKIKDRYTLIICDFCNAFDFYLFFKTPKCKNQHIEFIKRMFNYDRVLALLVNLSALSSEKLNPKQTKMSFIE